MTNGLITGRTKVSGNWNFTLQVSDSGRLPQTLSLPLTISIATPVVMGGSMLSSAVMGSKYSASMQASGGLLPYTWSLANGSLPSGLSLDPATGAVTGTPTVPGAFSFSLAVTDGSFPAQQQVASAAISVSAPPLMVYPSVPVLGVSGKAYSTTPMTAKGGIPPYQWSLAGGNLPAGLSLSPTTGVVSGTPTTPGISGFAIAVRDSGTPIQQRVAPFAIVVTAPPLVIVPSAPAPGVSGTAYSATPLTASGGTAPYQWSLAGGSLPAGLSLSSATGVISGTPSASGTFGFALAVKDSGTPTQQRVAPFAITVASSPLVAVSSTPASGVSGTAYSATPLMVTGGTQPYSWSVAAGSLPAGLSLSSTTGVISGTPSAAGISGFALRVTDSSSPMQVRTLPFSITVTSSSLTASLSTPIPGVSGTAYSATPVRASGGTPPYNWAVAAGSLPTGLSLSSTTGVVSGTPSAAGIYGFAIQVTDSSSPMQARTLPFLIAVTSSPLSISTATLPSGTDGTAYAAGLSASGGTPAYTWSIVAGSLPSGLTLAATTGVISGTPTVSGTYGFAVSAHDNAFPVQVATVAETLTLAAPAAPSAGSTWYVRPDGGTRYSSNVPNGQCDGLGDVGYSGIGTNQHCAFNDVRYLYGDGTYNTGITTPGINGFPAWGWIGTGGDTYIVRGSIADGVSYRVGYNSGIGSYDGIGVAGDPYGSGMPAPPSGTAAQHTQILGGNFGNCQSATARTQLHGGYGVNAVMTLGGASYVDVACFDITDFSSCSKDDSGANACSRGVPLSDYASVGIDWSNTSTHDTVTDVKVHGLAGAGMHGPTGDGVVISNIQILGNANSGWNADDGSTGNGSLLVQNFVIAWNGCAEEYPIVHSQPYTDCLDQSSGGYGDGFGTATVVASPPGWQAHFDQGTVYYNTQDGLDALHLTGAGSSMTITNVLAYGNMGNQLKVGGAQGNLINNIAVGNCYAMGQAIPGTPAGFNSHLSNFCRGGDTDVLITLGHGTTTHIQHNTFISAEAVVMNIGCDGTQGACDTSSLIDYRDNLVLGNYDSNVGRYPASIFNLVQDTTYNDAASCNAASNHFWQTDGIVGCVINPFASPGSSYDHNVTFQTKYGCPDTLETNAICTNPGLKSETVPMFGYPDLAISSTSSTVYQGGVAVTGITTDNAGKPYHSTPSVGALEYGSTIVVH